MIRGAEWADQGSRKALVTREGIEQKLVCGAGFAIRACSGRFPSKDHSPNSTLVSSEFLSLNPGGASRYLEPFWVRLSVFRPEQADHRFPISAGEGPSSVNKVLSGTPLPDCYSGLVLNDLTVMSNLHDSFDCEGQVLLRLHGS